MTGVLSALGGVWGTKEVSIRDVFVEALERRRSGECVVDCFTRDASTSLVAFGCGAVELSRNGFVVVVRSEVEAVALPRSLVLRVSRSWSGVSSPPRDRSGLVVALGVFFDFVKTPLRRPTGDGDLVVFFLGGTRLVKLRLERRDESVDDSTDCVRLAEERVDRAEAIWESWSSSICGWGSGKWVA